MLNRFLLCFITGVSALSLAACGGGGGHDDEADDGPEDASGAGLWFGSYQLDGQSSSNPMFGLVTEEGDFTLVAVGNANRPSRIFFGTGSTNGQSFSANAVSYFGPGKTPTSLSGSIVDRSSISGSYSLTGESATFSLAFRVVYDRASSLQALAGSYTASVPTTSGNSAGVVTIDVTTSGSFTYVSSVNGCMITGAFTVPHPDRNYYRWTGTAAGCSTADGALSGTAYLDDNSAGANRTLTMFGQNQAQTSPFLVNVNK